jgi:plastocyanin
VTARATPPSAQGLVLALGLALIALTCAPVALATPSQSGVSTAAASETVDISATSQISFVPDSFTVAPGSTVHLVVTQLATFAHTFTLSSVVNQTVPTGDSLSQVAAFFNAHAPLVNLSLGTTSGAQFTATFTAPTVQGSYEFLCLVHFPSMLGTMMDTNTSASTSGPAALPLLDIAAIVGVVIIVAIVAAVVLAGRRAKAPPPAPRAPEPPVQ